jgi:hypothetical protein
MAERLAAALHRGSPEHQGDPPVAQVVRLQPQRQGVIAWVGQALAARLLHAEKAWDHDAFFDYVDRWMTEDDTQHLEEIKKAKGWDYSMSWARQRQTWDPFVEAMWAKYRNNLPAKTRDEQEISKQHGFSPAWRGSPPRRAGAIRLGRLSIPPGAVQSGGVPQ